MGLARNSSLITAFGRHLTLQFSPLLSSDMTNMKPRRSKRAFVRSGESGGTDFIREAEAETAGGATVGRISGLPVFPEASHRILAYLDTDKPKETKEALIRSTQ